MDVTITDDRCTTEYRSYRIGDVERFALDYKQHPENFQWTPDSVKEVMLDSARTLGFYND